MTQRVLGFLLVAALLMPLILGAALAVQIRQTALDVRQVSDQRIAQIETDLQTIETSLAEISLSFEGVPATIDTITASVEELKTFVLDLSDNVPGWLAFLTGFQGAINDTLTALDDLTSVVRSIASIHELPDQFSSVMAESRLMADDLEAVYDTRAGSILWLAGLLVVWLAGVYVALTWKWLTRGWRMMRGTV